MQYVLSFFAFVLSSAVPGAFGFVVVVGCFYQPLHTSSSTTYLLNVFVLCVQGRFALHVASKALEYYAETVFKVPYPLKKSDLLAIPGTVYSPLGFDNVSLLTTWPHTCLLITRA